MSGIETALPALYPAMSDEQRDASDDAFRHPLNTEEPASARTVEEIVKAAIRPAAFFVCCGSGCAGCPEFWGT